MDLWPVFLVLTTIAPSCALWLSPVRVPNQDGQKNSAFRNLHIQMYLGTTKTITLLISFELLYAFEGDKGSSASCVNWPPAFNCLYTWKELISLTNFLSEVAEKVWTNQQQ